ncbi:Ig-like domain repeat protein [Saccharothrix sp. Mg75]|uniref:Ig-like domain repeat protein n=1 Tax=Saccharothrix sp. Mg75 TaxID=3445357 RepID=UPI003EEFCA9A
MGLLRVGGVRPACLGLVAVLVVPLLVGATAPAAVTAPVSDVVVSVEVSASPVAIGDEVVFTASVSAAPVSAGAGTPTGTVRFSVDGQPPGEPVGLVAGRASTSSSTLPTGAHAVTVDYGGDAVFRAADAGPGGRVVVVPKGTSSYVPVPPARLLDTRPGPAQTGYAGPKPAAGGSTPLQVTGRGGVPASGVSAVVLNVTATEAEAAGHITVHPAGQPRPVASSLNVEQPGQTVPNLVVVPVPASGRVALFTYAATHLVADVAGYFTPEVSANAGRLAPLTPARLLDTRPHGPQTGYTGGKPASGSTVRLQVTGRGGVPAEGVAGVVLNVTAVGTTAPGFVAVLPGGQPRPAAASNLNITRAGQITANAVWTPVSPDGTVDLYLQESTDLVTDVVGWFTTSRAPTRTSGLFVPTTPTRVLDTRPNGPQVGYRGGKPGPTATVTAAGTPIPASGAAAVVANVTGVDATDAGFVSAFPAGSARPATSSLNLEFPGQIRPNLVTSPLGGGNAISLYTQSGTHLLADVAGWFTADLDPAPPTTQRLTTTPAPGTVLLDPASATAVEGGPDTGYVVTVAAGVPAPAQGGGVVLKGGGAAYPQGLAGRVGTATRLPDGTTRLTVSPVALDQLFQDLQVGYDGPAALVPTPVGATRPAEARTNDVVQGETSIDRSVVEFGAGAFECNVSTGVSVSAALVRFENTRVHFEQRVGFLVAPYVRFTVQTEPVVQFSADVHGKVSCRLSAAFRATHRLVWALPTPVPVTVDLAPALEFEATVAGKVSVTERFHRMIGFSTNPDLTIRSYNAASRTTEQVSVGPQLSASLLMGADVSVKLLDLAGIGLTLGPKFTASIDHRGCVDLSVGIAAAFDLRLNLWIKQYQYTPFTLTLGSWTLYHRCPDGSQPLTVATTGPRAFEVGRPANAQLLAAGGSPPYSWSATNLPAGLGLSTGGVLSGTPTTTGTVSAAVRVADQRGATATATVRFTVSGPVGLTPATWQTARTRMAYTQYLDIGDCYDRALSYRATGLPPGLALVGGAAQGVLAVSGVPTRTGTFDVTVDATCLGQAMTLRVRLRVDEPPAPTPGEVRAFGVVVGAEDGTAGPFHHVSQVRPSPDGRYLAAAVGIPQALVVHDTVLETTIALTHGLGSSGTGHGSWSSNLAWSPDSRYLAFSAVDYLISGAPANPDGYYDSYDIFLWDSQERRIEGVIGAGDSDTESENPVWSPDGNLLAFSDSKRGGSGPGVVRTWNPSSGTTTILPCGTGSSCRLLASSTPGATEPWSADSRYLSIVEHEEDDYYATTGLRVWDRATGGSKPVDAPGTSGVRLAVDGRTALLYRYENGRPGSRVSLADVASGAVLKTFEVPVSVGSSEMVAASVLSRTGGHFVGWACLDNVSPRCGPAVVDTATGAVNTSLTGIGAFVAWVGDSAVFKDRPGAQTCLTALSPTTGARRPLGCTGLDTAGADATGVFVVVSRAPGITGLAKVAV